jgi:alpha-1,2-mannosyltransferase
MTWWMRIDQLLNDRRMSYAWIAGGVLWAAWLLSVVLGPGNMDLAHQVVGTDYLQFYAAGVTLHQGHSADLYNFSYQAQLEQAIAGPGLTSFHAFITPPFLAWLYVPFSLLPYTWSFVTWSLLSLVFLWISIFLISIEKSWKSLLWSLTWFPIFAALSFGQNSLLSLLIFSLSYWLWRKDKYLLAGLVSSLLLYKPQLLLGIGLLWLLDWRTSWKSLLGVLMGGGILAGLSLWLLPDASHAYINLARNVIPGMIYQEQFPVWHLHALRGFFFLLFHKPVWLIEGLSILLSAVGVVAFIVLWRSKKLDSMVLFASAICLTIWITPHAMIYDWSILLIPAVLLWRSYTDLHPLLKSLYAMIWLVTFLSGPLTYLQMKILPIALQISIPVFFFVLLTIFRVLKTKAPGHVNLEMAQP